MAVLKTPTFSLGITTNMASNQSVSVEYPVEVNKIPIFRIKITVSVMPKVAMFLESLGFSDAELPNKLSSILDDVVVALDGSVEGLVVSNSSDGV